MLGLQKPSKLNNRDSWFREILTSHTLLSGPQNPESKAQTNLIVNYLPPSMSDDEVRNLFETVGAVQSCKVIREKLSQSSLGYAFINYVNGEDAQRAIDSLNGLPLQSKTIKVSYARPSSNTIKNANLYVAYLPNTFTQSDLESYFVCHGKIITSKILTDTSGLCKGVGFVRFDKHSEAEAAINALNGKLLPGCTQPIMVKYANQKNAGSNVSNNTAVPTVMATNGAIPGLVPPTRRGNAAFNPSGAGGPIRHAPLAPNLRYNPVSIMTAPPSLASIAAATGSPQGFCLFVYNLPDTAEDALLYQLFGPFGAISSVRVIKDATGKCKRFGFVNMLIYDDACRAIVALNGYDHEGRTLQVSFKKD